MARGFSGALLKALGAKDVVLTVAGSTWITPHFLRIHFRSDSLFEFIEVGPAAWLRFWFKDSPSAKKEYQRAYTIAAARPEAKEIDVDFVIHETVGPACEWAINAQPGDQVVVQSYGSEVFELDAGAHGLLLVADASSIPAINGVLRSLPQTTPVSLIFEANHDHDLEIPLFSHPLLERVNITRSQDAIEATVANALRDNWQVWAAGETGSLKKIRKLVRSRAGATKRNTHVLAYWIEGKAMGTARESAA